MVHRLQRRLPHQLRYETPPGASTSSLAPTMPPAFSASRAARPAREASPPPPRRQSRSQCQSRPHVICLVVLLDHAAIDFYSQKSALLGPESSVRSQTRGISQSSTGLSDGFRA